MRILVDNAIKYTVGSSTITVDAKEHQISFENYTEPITKEQVSQLFDRFYRVVSSRNRATGGSGLGLAIANGLAALAGSVYCQMNGFFEISIGTGTVVIGLANVIIGISLVKHFNFIKPTTAVVIGAIIYKACVSIAISMGLAPSDLKLITAALLLIILAAGNLKKRKGGRA